MATLKYIISPSQGSSWSGIIDLGGGEGGLGFPVSSTTPISVSAVNGGLYVGGISFTPAEMQNFGGGGDDGSYFTMRSVAGGPYPTSGYSIDIWSNTLTAAIAGGSTWFSLEGDTFNLSTEKFSLMYDYTGLTAPSWSKGGTIAFSLP